MAAAVAGVAAGSPATAASMVMGMVISASFLSLFSSEAILVVRDLFNAKDHPLRWSLIALSFAIVSAIALFMLVMADLRKVSPYKLVVAWWKAAVGYTGPDGADSERERLISLEGVDVQSTGGRDGVLTQLATGIDGAPRVGGVTVAVAGRQPGRGGVKPGVRGAALR